MCGQASRGDHRVRWQLRSPFREREGRSRLCRGSPGVGTCMHAATFLASLFKRASSPPPCSAAGEFAEGKWHGKGRCLYADGSKYEGAAWCAVMPGKAAWGDVACRGRGAFAALHHVRKQQSSVGMRASSTSVACSHSAASATVPPPLSRPCRRVAARRAARPGHLPVRQRGQVQR